MRVTKAELLRRMRISEEFASLPFKCVAPGHVTGVCGEAGFIAAERYGLGMHVRPGEFGMVGRVRFKVNTRSR